MIRKLRIKFIALSMAALFVLLAIILTSMNVINYRTVVAEADTTLLLLAKNGGVFPDFDGSKKNDLPRDMSPETPYETRYFFVLLDGNGNVIQANTSRIKSIDTKQAIEYATQVLSDGKQDGFIDDYRYVTYAEENRIRITFLNCEQKLKFFYSFLMTSLWIALTGYLLFFAVVVFFSKKIMRPVAESYEKQKQFITDAGHEIKTPLTIIKADTDVLEMDFGENEWLSDIRKQTVRLTSLTNDLVYLSRMEEAGDSMAMIEFPFSDVVGEAAASFQALAQTQGKEFQCDIQPMLSLNGNEKAIQQLVGILLDNALKYSPKNGMVSLKVWKQNRAVYLSVLNTTESPVQKDKLDLLFERFYRTDTSRNSQTGGYGIGLSVAKAIVSAHSGRIQATTTEDGMSLRMTVCFSA
ncbi:sensor histidine kinase [Bianquea renquensis]|jgi:his kinase A (phosphoacceptor) domain./histidine kinase-, DNA gyrase B-, and HSP90-like ATPase|uniref:histidine kinase n=1 Tax=Bianquea renquensis TaxID=2763661 RepID=A0A926I0P5_9FIRM|nr:HAMP domain-containing sensor histidine kinase [Bianquea renquensis]MBC8543409.1 HAMP domain-containing histidine kinase [Bianquea renquensis]